MLKLTRFDFRTIASDSGTSLVRCMLGYTMNNKAPNVPKMYERDINVIEKYTWYIRSNKCEMIGGTVYFT